MLPICGPLAGFMTIWQEFLDIVFPVGTSVTVLQNKFTVGTETLCHFHLAEYQ
jgi:hypothetical protein